MTAKTHDNLPLLYDWVRGEYYKPGMDANLRLLGAAVHIAVESRTSDEPGTPADGNRYIHNGGTWSVGSAGDLIARIAGTWYAYTPADGWTAKVLDEKRWIEYESAAGDWVAFDSVLHNDSATADPTATDDTDAGYSAGSRWHNTSSGELFRCVDATTGSAVWLKTTLTLDELGSAATVEADQNLRTTDAPDFGGHTISATQYGYLGALDQGVATSDSPAFAGLTLNGNYRTKTTVAAWLAQITDDSNTDISQVRDSADNIVGKFKVLGLDGAGAPATLDFQTFAAVQFKGNDLLDASDLAANGGDVVTDDRTNTFIERQVIEAPSDSPLEVSSTGGSGDRARIQFAHPGNGNVAAIQYREERIQVYSGYGGSFNLVAQFRNGLKVGNPTGGWKGNGTVNADSLYQVGNPVLDTTDLAANGGPLPEVDRTNVFGPNVGIKFTGVAAGMAVRTQVEDDSNTRVYEYQDSGGNVVAEIQQRSMDGAGAGGLRWNASDFYEFIGGGIVAGLSARNLGTGGISGDLIGLHEKSSDPSDPPEGESVMWQSDGTGTGADGDILMKITADGVTKTATVVDFSAV